MIQFTTNLKQEIDCSLLTIRTKEVDALMKAGQITNLLKDAFQRLRIFMSNYKFVNETEEILFFKEIKPHLFCDLIFYQKMYNLEINSPAGGYGEQKAYLEKELWRIFDFFDKNRFFYCYIRSGDTSMDDRYYLRGQDDVTLYHNSIAHERDPLFSTVADLKLTRILANNKLEVYIKEKLIEQEELLDSRYNGPKVKLAWTMKKVFLIELIYLLYWVGAFNHGEASLKAITAYFEKVFNIELGANPATSFSEIRDRKNSFPFFRLLSRVFTEYKEKFESK